VSEIANYFTREKYITRRLSLLALGGTILLTAIAVAIGHGRLPVRLLGWTVFVAFAVVFIVRGAYAKFPKSGVPDDFSLDVATRRKLRRRVWLLEFFAGFYALGLLNALIHARSGSWLATAIGAAITLLFEVALIKAIRRLKRKLKPALAASAR
jgi:uncharacterized membrane protein